MSSAEELRSIVDVLGNPPNAWPGRTRRANQPFGAGEAAWGSELKDLVMTLA